MWRNRLDSTVLVLRGARCGRTDSNALVMYEYCVSTLLDYVLSPSFFGTQELPSAVLAQ